MLSSGTNKKVLIMNDLIEKKIIECYQIIDGLNKTFGDSISKLLCDWGEKYYNLLDNENRQLISFELFKEKVLEYTFEKAPPKVLKDLKIEPWLDPIWRKNDKTRWNNYKKLLEKEGKAKMVSQLDADTFAILDNCYNPETDADIWERRGLVYGHVQSGKTANYIGLANKAFDVGYRIVIILTGMTEDLRKQTQDRVNSGIIGADENGEAYGVGLLPTHKTGAIKAGTNIKFDLSTANINTQISTLSLDQNIVFVVKKNVSVLKCLREWLYKKKVAQVSGQYKIIDTPFLIIDDEADNASIQSLSKKDFLLEQEGIDIREIEDVDEADLTPEQIKTLENAQAAALKAINRNIRICLSLIAQKTFVAYTATPYSVMAQRMEGLEREIEEGGIKYTIDEDSDLFPEHFIIPIEPGIKYMGIEKIFGSNRVEGLPVLNIIPDTDQKYFPVGSSKSYDFNSIPDSLEIAIIHFIVVIFVRESRKQSQHNTMLVHTSHRVDKIDYVAYKIGEYLETLKSRIQTNPNLLLKFKRQLELIRNNSKNELFKKHFDLDVEKYFVLDEIATSDIYTIIDKILLVSYHSKIRDTNLKHNYHKLNYPNLEEEPEKTRIYIVVGGNRISRGFTLEGLSTSYFAREVGSQDTLYQMGRWFGYRIGYEDTILIFMAKEQLSWFKGILHLELDLRNDLAQMNENEMTPSMWEIKMVHSTSFEDLNRQLKLCDVNRLRNTRKKKLSFGGTNQTTKKLKRDNVLQKANFIVTQNFVNKLADEYSFVNSELYVEETNINFSKINMDYVISFLSEFQFQDEIFDTVQNFLKKNRNEFSSFSVVLKQNKYKFENEINPPWKIKNKNITTVTRNTAPDEKDNNDFYIIDTLLDKDLDNTFDIIDSENIVEYRKAIDEGKGSAFRYKLRNESKKAILIIYIVKGEMEKSKGDISFPVLYLSIPNVGDAVEYIIRNRRDI